MARKNGLRKPGMLDRVSSMMRLLAALFLLALPVFGKAPNIVLIIADDMAWDDSGVYGNPNVSTPNIDKLAGDGMLFHNAFLTASSCSPSRCSIITGRYPHNTDAEIGRAHV